MKKKTKKILLFVAASAILLTIIAAVVTVLLLEGDDDNEETFDLILSPPSDSPLGHFTAAAVSCDAEHCADIAKDILADGGSVADAAIGGLLCMGVVHTHSLGIGGGFLLVIFNATTNETRVLNARETAPAAASVDMFAEHPENSTRGGLAVAIPGEIRGYWELYQNHGRLPWKRLFDPTIALCRNGFKVTSSAAAAFEGSKDIIKEEPSLAEIFVNDETNEVWKEGDIITRLTLADTLETIATTNGSQFYEGPIAEALIEDLESFGGIITLDDLKNYQVRWEEVIDLKIQGGYTIKTVPPPGSGILLGFMLRVLSDYLPLPTSISDYTTVFQRIIETFKYTYAQRTMLGDPTDVDIQQIVEELVEKLKTDSFAEEIRDKLDDTSTNNTVEYYGGQFDGLPDDQGTAHISIIDLNGDAISVTSTINFHFGAKIRSTRTGIIFNNQMDDFSSPNITSGYGLPPSVNNFIKPQKRPMSSMCPAIFTDEENRVRLVVGAAGGTKITTSTALVSLRTLWFEMNIKEAIDERRVHHQLFPMEISYEEEFSNEIIDNLEIYGHNTITHALSSSIVSGVQRSVDGTLLANYDFRKSGSISGY